MSTIQDLPKEVLLALIKKLQATELKEFQKVCRVWYSYAHPFFLKEIYLGNPTDILRFIKSIDQNSNSSYFKAVEKISISNMSLYSVALPLEVVWKLLFRFPSLKSLQVYNYECLFDDFNDRLCHSFLEACPNLIHFEVDSTKDDDDLYNKTVLKLHLLITKVDLDRFDFLSEFEGGVATFLTAFPRLRSIIGGSDYITNFQTIIPVFEHVPHLTQFSVGGEEDEDDFARRFLQTKPSPIQDLIIKRLSNVHDLTWSCYTAFSIPSAKFVAKYLTGLESLYIFSDSNSSWTDDHQAVFCNDMLDIIYSTKHLFYVIFESIPFDMLLKCFPLLMTKAQKAYKKGVRRVLDLSLNDRRAATSTTPLSKLLIRFFQNTDVLTHISANVDLGLKNFVMGLFNQADMLHGLEKFALQLPASLDLEMDIDLYDIAFDKMPSLTEIELDIPATCIDSKPNTNVLVHDSVEKLTLKLISMNTTSEGYCTFQKLLDKYGLMFPNLRHLSLYTCGDLHNSIDKITIVLSNYSLESLVIDMNGLGAQMKQKANTQGFCVVEITLLQDDTRLFYKLTDDVSSANKIRQKDLDGLTCGKDYISLRIQVKSLKNIGFSRQSGVFEKVANVAISNEA